MIVALREMEHFVGKQAQLRFRLFYNYNFEAYLTDCKILFKIVSAHSLLTVYVSMTANVQLSVTCGTTTTESLKV